MELKEMIAELGRHADGRVSVHCITAAAEALALVAWAEEVGAEIGWWLPTKWLCEVCDCNENVKARGTSDTILGAIRAAKEAYEQSR